MDQFWLKSTLFNIDPNEDQDTNPRIYGKQFANWLSERLKQIGYQNIECFPEDWGWCIVVFWKPFRLFIGCANVYDYDQAKESDPPPEKDKIIWSCSVMAEIPLFKRIFKKVDVSPEKTKLELEIEKILKNETKIQLVEEP